MDVITVAGIDTGSGTGACSPALAGAAAPMSRAAHSVAVAIFFKRILPLTCGSDDRQRP